MSKSVAVVYLARVPEGIDVFARFADSYRKYDAGYPHDLILLAKGMENRGEKAYIEEIFKGIRHELMPISDEGFDINAYLDVARLLPHDYILFCNTHTEMLSGDWLGKMMAAGTSGNVGFVAATASYESISQSQKFISKAVWMTSNGRLPFDSEFYAVFKQYLSLHSPKWIRSRKLKHRIAPDRFIKELFKARPDLTGIVDEFESYWAGITSDTGPLGEFRKFPYFPNAHLRSNCFLIETDLLRKLNFKLKLTKIECNLFESGVDSLSARLLRQGRKLLVVGADGTAFDVQDWPRSGTFRLGQQSNLLFGDNQTRSFDALSIEERELLSILTWGDYIDNAVPERLKLGFAFEKNDRLLRAPHRQTDGAAEATAPKALLSIVIPTHNRLALVSDAIETVRRDRRHNWELVVFDNCSAEPLEAHVRALNDDRIAFFRSDTFLPVTESWNQAIAKARGDYVMLLGDDDGLVPGFFDEVTRLIEEFDEPDCIYCSFYQFFHPGVAPWQRSGYVSDLRNAYFFSGRELPFVLNAREKAHAINGSLRLRRNFAFNMQSFVFSRKLLSRLTIDSKVFYTPFPDYYIANVAFAAADRIVAHPKPLTIAGVSRQSFGYTLFNNLEEAGAKLLKTDLKQHESFEKCKPYILPGPTYLTNYLVTMQQVRDALPSDRFASLDFDRYRRRQIVSFIPATSKRLNWLKGAPARGLWERLSFFEKLWALRLSFSKKRRQKSFYSRKSQQLKDEGFVVPQVIKNVGDYTSTLELYKALEERRLGPDAAT
jgi:glycosyltransferase involved in cell wall biosynthesis